MIMKSINYRIWYLCFSIFILSACSGGGDLDDLLNKPTQNTTDNNGNNGDNNGDNNSAYITVVSSLSFDSGSSSKSVNITSNIAWSYECYESWVTVKKDSPSQMTVSVSANTSSERWAYIYFKEDGKSANLATLIVKQSAGTSSGGSDKTFTVSGNGKTVTFKMIYVQGGTFTMGATSEQGSDARNNEKPTHTVTLSSYHIGETEVTQELWIAVMGSNPSLDFISNKKPVDHISWNDCQSFITKLNSLTGYNFRLPTEAEWEFAARGGNKSNGYKYSGSNTIGDVAWYDKNSYSVGSNSSSWGIHDVATKKANELGLYDMSGNVWERCQDWYGEYSSNNQTNPTGPSSSKYNQRVERGGGWSDYAEFSRVSSRQGESYTYQYDYVGLRLAL